MLNDFADQRLQFALLGRTEILNHRIDVGHEKTAMSLWKDFLQKRVQTSVSRMNFKSLSGTNGEEKGGERQWRK